MRMSQYFLPTLKETPSEAQIVSHRLMLRAGMIRQTSAGIYAWLPLGLRVLRNIERIVREEQDRAGAQEVLMPTIQSADLWRESGRYDAYGPEMLRIRTSRTAWDCTASVDSRMISGRSTEAMTSSASLARSSRATTASRSTRRSSSSTTLGTTRSSASASS